MNTYVIRCLGLAGLSSTGGDIPTGQWLRYYDPDAFEGRGWAEWTDDPNRALTFSDYANAHALWTTIPRRRPRREDGQPNRPLAAFTIEVTTLDHALADAAKGA